jgi:hypothetical protein
MPFLPYKYGVRRLVFSSVLPLAYRDELERIVFFNPRQDRVSKAVVDSVHQFGVPSIVEDQGTLRFRVPAFGAVQTLYALDQDINPATLLGVAIFVRENRKTVLVLHLAVHEDYAVGGPNEEDWVASRLLATVRSACRHIRGIKRLRLLYPREFFLKLEGQPRLAADTTV